MWLRGVGLALGVVGAAHQRAGLDVAEAEPAPERRELGELVGVIVARDRQVLRRGSEVLTEGENGHADLAEVAQRGQQLVALFAEPEDDARLGRDRRRELAGAAEELKRPCVPAAVPRHLVEARDRLRVVVQDRGPCLEHRGERRGAPLEIGDQRLDAAARGVPMHGAEGLRPVPGAAVGEVVAVDRRDHHVLEAELADRAADALGLLAVLPRGPTVRDRAVAAVARAHVAQDHEGRRRVLPALADVRAAGLLADGMEVPLAHAVLEAHVVRAAGRANLEPRRLAPVAGALGLDDRE